MSIVIAAALPCVRAAAANSDGVFNVLDYGAKGDGTTSDTAAVQKAVDVCAAAGGGQVLLPAGKTFLTGVITLHSHLDFHLASGSVLKGSADWHDYGHEGSLLFAKDATNLTISGDGTIDGNDRALWQKLADEQAGGDVNRPNWWPQSFVGDYWPFGKTDPRRPAGRPLMMILIGCKQLHIRELTLTNAPSWTVHLVGCEDALIDAIRIRNAWDVPNCDGIDLDHCRDVRVVGCSIECADDGIVIKNTPNFASYGGSARITITGCTLASRSAALKIDEIYTQPGARDIVFADCVISRSNRGLCIQSRDEGDIQNVIFSNIIIETRFWTGKWWGSSEPITVYLAPRSPQTQLGHVRNIRFNNILARGENGAFLSGTPGHPLEDIALDHVRIEMAKIGDEKGGFYDLRPQNSGTGLLQMKLAGVYAREIAGLSITQTKVIWNEGLDDYYGLGFDQANVKNLDTDHVDFPDAPVKAPPKTP